MHFCPDSVFFLCWQAYCTGQTGRSEPSFGRRRRAVDEDQVVDGKDHDEDEVRVQQELAATNGTEEEEQVREMIEVRSQRDGAKTYRRLVLAAAASQLWCLLAAGVREQARHDGVQHGRRGLGVLGRGREGAGRPRRRGAVLGRVLQPGVRPQRLPRHAGGSPGRRGLRL